MTEENYDNPSEAEHEEVKKLDDGLISGDAWPVCPQCFVPCHPLQNYCENCDSNEAINPLASYMPFVRIRFNIGMLIKLWRRIRYDKETSIMSALFYLLLLVMALLILPGRGCL
ncbi:MAG: hypothetical protein ACYS21_20825 [Planctomycetota bacterium]|jgi:hypothetical protein